jgi:hypothetical protein
MNQRTDMADTPPDNTTPTSDSGMAALTGLSIAGMAALTGGALYVSYLHALEFATHYGVTGASAYIVAATVDGVILMAALRIAVAARRGERLPADARIALLLGLGATGTANAWSGAPHGPVGIAVGLWVPSVLELSYRMLMGVLRGTPPPADAAVPDAVPANLADGKAVPDPWVVVPPEPAEPGPDVPAAEPWTDDDGAAAAFHTAVAAAPLRLVPAAPGGAAEHRGAAGTGPERGAAAGIPGSGRDMSAAAARASARTMVRAALRLALDHPDTPIPTAADLAAVYVRTDRWGRKQVEAVRGEPEFADHPAFRNGPGRRASAPERALAGT